MSDKLPHVEVHEAMCKSIGDMAKENEALKKRIERLEEAGDSILVWMMFNRRHMVGMDVDSAVREWKQAKKEAKP